MEKSAIAVGSMRFIFGASRAMDGRDTKKNDSQKVESKINGDQEKQI